jgi:hypothetical protein
MVTALKEAVIEDRTMDCIGRPRSPATLPGYHADRVPGNKGLRYPADPPALEEIIAVMRAAVEGAVGDRLRGLIVVLWRAACGQRGARAHRERSGPRSGRGHVVRVDS